MAGELVRRAVGSSVDRRTYRAVAEIAAGTKVQQATIRAKSAVGEFAVSEVTYLKELQRESETRNPDAAEAIALIVTLTVQGIARSVSQFGSEGER